AYRRLFFFSSRRRHTRSKRDWSSDVCSSDLKPGQWNELEITLDGPRTIVMLNGQKVTDYKEGDPVPPKTRNFEPNRGPRPLTGYIGVQNHDALSTVYFKEIAVKSIPRK